MRSRELKTAKEVVQELGGPAATGRLTGRSAQAVWNWTATGKLPADAYLLITDALKLKGRSVSPKVFGMAEAQSSA